MPNPFTVMVLIPMILVVSLDGRLTLGAETELRLFGLIW
jgi:hypothetical protein